MQNLEDEKVYYAEGKNFQSSELVKQRVCPQRAKGGNDKHRYSSFKIQEVGKKEEDSKALIIVDTLDEIEEGAAKIYNLITGVDTKEVSTTVMLENLLS
ncbi:hypothetical protein Tco_1210905 [Tanacetum coccineum]